MNEKAPTELEQRLAKARAKIDGHAKAREARDADAAQLREVEDLEREANVVEAIATAEHELGTTLGRGLERVDVHHADGSIACTVLVKTPHPAVWRRFKNAVGDAKGAKKEEALEHFYRPCIVWPEADVVSTLADRFARLPDLVADTCATLAGAREDETRKK